MKRFVSSLLVAIAGGVIALSAYTWIGDKNNQQPRGVNQSVPAYLTSGSSMPSGPMVLPDFTVAASNTVHAVVHIKTEYERKSSVYDNFFDLRDFFGDRAPQRGGRPEPIIATGSGVIISPDGYIVTNNHVVTEANKVNVTLNDKRTYEATVVGTDPSTDLAVIKINAKDLPYLLYGNSDDLQIGEWVLAVGNPFNLTSTVTAGIVSAKARNINILGTPDGSAIESFIQTDAAVNRGNSGGALVNTAGQLVGINAAIASGTGFYAGYSFAIPVNIVRKVVSDLREFGTVQRGFLGVSIRDIDSKLAQDEKITALDGVYIADVTEKSAADAAGIRKGDVILNIEGVPVNSTSELLEIVGQHRPGDKIAIAVRRGNNDKTYNVTLRNRSGNTDPVKREAVDVENMLGATLKPIDSDLKDKLGLDYGMQIVALRDGKLRNAGIREGFIILKLDGKRIDSAETLSKALENKEGGVLLEGIYPNKTRAYYGFGM